MKYSQSIKPISYLKAHASEVVRGINDNHETMIITQHGEAKVVIQDVKVFEQTVESLAMLKLLAQMLDLVRMILRGKFFVGRSYFFLRGTRFKAQYMIGALCRLFLGFSLSLFPTGKG